MVNNLNATINSAINNQDGTSQQFLDLGKMGVTYPSHSLEQPPIFQNSIATAAYMNILPNNEHLP
jgi:hypothetical protein